jgi:hypothetical protein
MVQCYRGCGTEIKFDKAVRSQSGKMIPLELDGNRHQCPNSQYNASGSGSTGTGTGNQQETTTTTAVQKQQPPVTPAIQPQQQQQPTTEAIQKFSEHLEKITAQLAHLSEFYDGMMDDIGAIRNLLYQQDSKRRHDQRLASAEEQYDQDREDGTIGLG